MAAGWRGQRRWSHPTTLAEQVVCPLWAAVLGSGTRADADNRTTTNLFSTPRMRLRKFLQLPPDQNQRVREIFRLPQNPIVDLAR